MVNPPVISDKPPYQKAESGEGHGYPRPEPDCVRPLDAAAGIGVAGVRHDLFRSWLAGGADDQIAGSPECSGAWTFPPLRSSGNEIKTRSASVAQPPERPAHAEAPHIAKRDRRDQFVQQFRRGFPLALRTFTDGAGGFLPGVPLGCLRMWDQHTTRRPRSFTASVGGASCAPLLRARQT
jgi:hypothetical protein